MTNQEAETRRDIGIARAERHANAAWCQWSEVAFDYLRLYCEDNPGDRFLAEELRNFAAAHGFTSANDKAWGAIMRKGAKEGLIYRYGYAPARSSNLSPKCLWEVV